MELGGIGKFKWIRWQGRVVNDHVMNYAFEIAAGSIKTFNLFICKPPTSFHEAHEEEPLRKDLLEDGVELLKAFEMMLVFERWLQLACDSG